MRSIYLFALRPKLHEDRKDFLANIKKKKILKEKRGCQKKEWGAEKLSSSL